MDTNTLCNLRKFLVPEIVYGEGALELAGRHAVNFGGTKVLIVTDPGVQETGWAAQVEESLQVSGIPYATFSNVTPNPKDFEVMEGVDVYRAEKCDLIIAVGGGSPMDCAKGIGVVAGNPGHITDFEGVDEVLHPGPPLIFIPTTAGTSADVSQFAIITNTVRKAKIAIISKMVIPDIALVDPKTTVTMAPALTAATGMDALCHAFEAFVSTASSPLTDMSALAAVRLIVDNLICAYHEPANMTCRNNMMMASLMAGLSFSNASLGLVHAMAHSLGGCLGLAHGECNAMLLEHVVRYNYAVSAEKYDQLAKVMGVAVEADAPDKSAALTDRLAAMRSRLGITQRLSGMGVLLSDIPRLAENACKDPCLATNPRPAAADDIERIYRRIYE
ncbi:MAG: iron-containing alcohol dehydrogenase [Deltaproteobacteria bacterium]|nr:iron-containing alcohol dehydrogenase [Deltaproteobacteria bacterium]